jgi:hypothetical protein
MSKNMSGGSVVLYQHEQQPRTISVDVVEIRHIDKKIYKFKDSHTKQYITINLGDQDTLIIREPYEG